MMPNLGSFGFGVDGRSTADDRWGDMLYGSPRRRWLRRLHDKAVTFAMGYNPTAVDLYHSKYSQRW